MKKIIVFSWRLFKLYSCLKKPPENQTENEISVSINSYDAGDDEREKVSNGELTSFNEFEFYKESYYHEIDYKEKLNNRTTVFFTIIPFFITFLLFFVKDIILILEQFNESPWMVVFYLLFLITLTVGVIWLVILIYKTVHGYEYSYIPTTQTIDAYKQKLIEEWKPTQEELNYEMKDYIMSGFISASTQNKLANQSKSIKFRTNTLMAAALLVIAGLTFIVYMNFEIGKKEEKPENKIQTQIYYIEL